jgi:hypothetical protein
VATRTKANAEPSLFKKASAGGYLPEEQSKWVEFRADDDPEEAPKIRVKIRTGLVNSDLKRLQRDSDMLDTLKALMKDDPADERTEKERRAAREVAEEVVMGDAWDRLGPYVLDWNIQHRADDGQVYDVLAPADVGGGAFAYAPSGLYPQILMAVIGRSYERIDPKSSASSATTDD